MSIKDISLAKAELMASLLEGVIYGFSLLMFGGTIWALLFQRSTCNVNRKMFAATCLLLLLSTGHFVFNIIRLMQGLALYHQTGSVQYFTDTEQWTYLGRDFMSTALTLVANAVVLYRCYVVWQSKIMLIFPVLLWCAVGVTGIGSTIIASHTQTHEAFAGTLAHWITAFVTISLVTNLLTTILLASRIWYIDRTATRKYGPRESQLRPMMSIILDAGVIYSLTLLLGLVCFLCQSNLQNVFLAMATPTISITFYMVIIRVGLANRAKHKQFTSTVSIEQERRIRIPVNITTMIKSKVENGILSPGTHVDSESDEKDVKHDGEIEAVEPTHDIEWV